MATTTTNLGLTKPALSESADVTVLKDNWDKVDTEAGTSTILKPIEKPFSFLKTIR